MPRIQKFGIKFPLKNDNEETYMDLNEDIVEEKKSELIHLILTEKGTRLRDPEFGTDLLKYIFDMSDGYTDDNIKETIKESVKKYINGVELIDFEILMEDENPAKKILSIDFSVKIGNMSKTNNVKVRI